jgi:flagellum-specific peptidoglycan hydrolase FlgJ
MNANANSTPIASPVAYRLTRAWADSRLQRMAEWTATMMAAAGPSAVKLGCSPEAIVAQAALESGWGAASIGFNIFGVIADRTWTGKRQLVWTTEYVDAGGDWEKRVKVQRWFRDYDSYADSFADHLAILEQANFKAVGVFDPDGTKSDADFFAALQKGGYATDPAYAAHLVDMLKSVHQFTACMVPAHVPPPAPPPRLLMTGCAGPDVVALQARLGVQEDGFQTKTRGAVVDFQRTHQLAVDGIVGPQTRTAIGL